MAARVMVTPKPAQAIRKRRPYIKTIDQASTWCRPHDGCERAPALERFIAGWPVPGPV